MQLTPFFNMLAVILTGGWLSSFLTQLIKHINWPSYTKLLLSLVMALIVGAAASWTSGDLTSFVKLWQKGTPGTGQVLTYATLVFTSAQVWYEKVWGDTLWAQTVAGWGSKTDPVDKSGG